MTDEVVLTSGHANEMMNGVLGYLLQNRCATEQSKVQRGSIGLTET